MRGTVLMIALAACGGGGGEPMPSPMDGTQLIEVAMPDGTTEPMYIHVASPPGDGPFPVVVYGHGQGLTSAVPACTAGPPTHDDVAPSRDVAEALADAGYIGVAIFYRGFGASDAGVPTLRDHRILDARAFLSAARWARDNHPSASNRVAVMGNSMGSFPATWAISSDPALADLQDGLSLETSIPSGMLGNHIANISPQFRELDDPSVDVTNRLAGTLLFALVLPSLRATPELDAGNLESNAIDLTPAGLNLVRRSFFAAPPAVPECVGLPAAYCSSACLGRVVSDAFSSLGTTDVRTSDWFTGDTIAAFDYWSPPDSIDPGTTHGSLLSRLRDISPAYSLPPVLPGTRMLPLLSTNDHTLPAQLGSTSAAADLYVAHLREAGASMPTTLPVVDGSGCDHGDYYRPERPECGWSLVTAELAASFD